MDERAKIIAEIELIHEANRVEQHVLSTEILPADDRKQRQLGIKHNFDRLQQLNARLRELGPKDEAK